MPCLIWSYNEGAAFRQIFIQIVIDISVIRGVYFRAQYLCMIWIYSDRFGPTPSHPPPLWMVDISTLPLPWCWHPLIESRPSRAPVRATEKNWKMFKYLNWDIYLLSRTTNKVLIFKFKNLKQIIFLLASSRREFYQKEVGAYRKCNSHSSWRHGIMIMTTTLHWLEGGKVK